MPQMMILASLKPLNLIIIEQHLKHLWNDTFMVSCVLCLNPFKKKKKPKKAWLKLMVALKSSLLTFELFLEQVASRGCALSLWRFLRPASIKLSASQSDLTTDSALSCWSLRRSLVHCNLNFSLIPSYKRRLWVFKGVSNTTCWQFQFW